VGIVDSVYCYWCSNCALQNKSL